MIYIKSTFILLFISLSVFLQAQLNLNTERKNATYEVGEVGYFTGKSAKNGFINYRIFYDTKVANIESGKLSVAVNTEFKIPFEAQEAGVYICQIEQDSDSDIAAMSFSPNQIRTIAEEPADFDAFWDNAKQELANIPMDVNLEFYSTYEDRTIYRLDLASIENRRVYGYITIPNGTGPYPAILDLPPFGNAANLVNPETFLSIQANAITLSIGIHNTPLDEIDEMAYIPDNTTDPNNFYYKKAILAGIRAIDYIYELDQFDGENLLLNGVSQGGGLAIIVAGIDERVSALAFSNAALCQHSAFKYGKASGFPYYLFVGTTPPQLTTQIEQAVQYFDAIYAARRFNGPVFATIGYEDLVCPAATVLAAYNEFKGPKLLVSKIKGAHGTPNDYWIDRVPFFRHFIPSMKTPIISWLSNTSYAADAGEDISIPSNAQHTLNGKVFFNTALNQTWSVRWEKVKGPGVVQFSDAQSRQTTFNCSATGTYILRFSAQIDEFLDADQKRILVEDYITISVF